MSVVFCLSEDRIIDEIGLRIAVCSLNRHCPESMVFVFRASPTEDFRNWLQRFPQVTLLPYAPPGGSSWNCKPQALLTLLDRGCSDVVWLDADLLLARDCRYLFDGLDPGVFAVAQESTASLNQGSESRTIAWGFPVGRRFPRTLNSCVIRATPQHRALLERWKSLLEDPGYAQYQTRPLHERPQHCWGDQDVLNALLGSTEFASVPVLQLRTGIEVIHCSSATSYSFMERIQGLFHPIPPFIHCQAGKPWVLFHEESISNRSWASRYNRLVVELGAYFRLSIGYMSEIPYANEWSHFRSLFGLSMRLLGFGNHCLRGLALTALASSGKLLLTNLRSLRATFKIRKLQK